MRQVQGGYGVRSAPRRRLGMVFVSVDGEKRMSGVSAAVGGDPDALRRLLQAHAQRLREHFDGRIGRRHRAVLSVDDVLQVTYMEAFLQIRQLRAEGEDAFFAWIRQIGENNLRDAIRALEADKRPDPERRIQSIGSDASHATFLAGLAGTDTTPTQHARRDEAKTILETALASLPPDYATALRLYDLEGRTIDEVGAAYDPPRTRGAVHMLRARAMDCLRVALGDPNRFLTTEA
ncbi:MAG: sigma-70 family RNA polymerase sigma factor [Planctomycetota bacterium]